MKAPADRSSSWSPLLPLVFICIAIGLPLIGLRVFSGADFLLRIEPWRQTMPADLEATTISISDTVDARQPGLKESAERLTDGDLPLMSDLSGGGIPIAATPVSGWVDPFNLPWYVMPPEWALGYAKFLEMAAAIGFTYLFCRRLGLRSWPSWTAGIAYAVCGFQVVWTNWPQPHTGALVPALFWAAERFIQRRRFSDAALFALFTGWQFLTGFPAVILYCFTLLAAYLVVRTVSLRRERSPRPALPAVVLGLTAIAGLALVAPQVVGLTDLLRETDLSAREVLGGHLPNGAIVTMAFPWAFGQGQIDPYLGPLNIAEVQSYLGVTALGLAGLTIVRRPRTGALRGSWLFFLAAASFLACAIYFGGPPLAALNALPFYDINDIGRARGMLAFCLAIVAAIGLDALSDPSTVRTGRQRQIALVVVAGAVVAAAVGGWTAMTPVDPRIATSIRLTVIVAVIFGACLVGCILATRSRRFGPLVPAALCALVAVEGLIFVLPYWPRIERDRFYPSNAAVSLAADRQGLDRVEGDRALWSGATRYYGLRTATGHQYFTEEWIDLFEAVDPYPFRGNRESFAALNLEGKRIYSPVLDRLSVRYVIRLIGAEIPGPLEQLSHPASTLSEGGSPIELQSSGGPIRGITFFLRDEYAPGPPGAKVHVEVIGSSGEVLARGLLQVSLPRFGTINIPVPAEDVPDQPVTIRISMEGPGQMTLGGPGQSVMDGVNDSSPLDDTLVNVIHSRDDGLRLVSGDSAAVYERTTALPRYRVASRAEVTPSSTTRLRSMVQGVDESVVLLEEPPALAGGGMARVVSVDQSDPDDREVVVESDGSTFLVIADALRDDWSATVDGEQVELLRADHAFMAVPVPDGRHTVRLRYTAPAWPASGVVALFSAGLLGVLVLVERRRRRATHAAVVAPTGAADDELVTAPVHDVPATAGVGTYGPGGDGQPRVRQNVDP